MAIQVEAVIHRIGGRDDAGPRLYGPWTRPISMGPWEQFDVPATGAEWGRYWMMLRFDRWEPADPHDAWMSCVLELQAMNGQLIGRRPALLFTEPHDVPTYTTIKVDYDDLGVFSVGLRCNDV